MFRVLIDQQRLIDLLEDEFRNVYENVLEEDRISKVSLTGSGYVEIIIGGEVE